MLSERVEIYKTKEMERLKEEREAHRTHKQMTSELKRTLLGIYIIYIFEKKIILFSSSQSIFLK